jgi:hypothetical protein
MEIVVKKFIGIFPLNLILKGLPHEIGTGLKICCWIDCPRRGAAGGFKNIKKLLRHLINVNRNVALQRKGMDIVTF